MISKVYFQHCRVHPLGLRRYFHVKTKNIFGKCIRFGKNKKSGYFFRAGNWDKNICLLKDIAEQDQRYEFYDQYFNLNIPIHRTSLYEYLKWRIHSKRPRRGFETDELIHVGLQKWIELFRIIEKAGKLIPSYEFDARKRNEIGCVLGRNRRLLKLSNGNNRLAIALYLGIQTVPIQIDFVHDVYTQDILGQPGLFPVSKINNFLEENLNFEI